MSMRDPAGCMDSLLTAGWQYLMFTLLTDQSHCIPKLGVPGHRVMSAACKLADKKHDSFIHHHLVGFFVSIYFIHA